MLYVFDITNIPKHLIPKHLLSLSDMPFILEQVILDERETDVTYLLLLGVPYTTIHDEKDNDTTE